MRQVIGYIYETITADFLKSQNMSPDELIGTTIQTRFAVAVDKRTIVERKTNEDIMDDMVSNNIGTLVKFNKENYTAEIMFQTPMPEDIFRKYHKTEKPIFKDGE